jgi:2-aminoadipate transaminase
MTTSAEQADYTELLSQRALEASAPGGAAFSRFSPDTVMLTAGMPDEDSFPLEALSKKAEKAILEVGKQILQYGQPRELTAWVADFMSREEAVEVKPENILLTCGSSQALGLACRAFINPGDYIIVEAPSFMGALRTFRNAEAKLAEVPMGEDGLDLAALEAKLAELKSQGKTVKFIYTIPTFHNPTGTTMGLEARQKLIDLAVKYNVMILEDDAYHSLLYEGEVPPTIYSLDLKRGTGRVVHCRTFSKILAAGWRLGWVAATPEVIQKILALKDDGATNLLGSYVAFSFARDGELEEHIKKLRVIYKQKRDRMMAALERYMPEGVRWTNPQGGFFIWLTLPEQIDSVAMLKKAAEAKVVYLPGTSCYIEPASGKNTIRLSFSFLKLAQVEPSIRKLGELLEAEIKG